MPRPRDSRFTPDIIQRMRDMRFIERRSCKAVAKYFGTTEKYVSKLLCNEGHCWDGKLLKVPEVATWDFTKENLF